MSPFANYEANSFRERSREHDEIERVLLNSFPNLRKTNFLLNSAPRNKWEVYFYEILSAWPDLCFIEDGEIISYLDIKTCISGNGLCISSASYVLYSMLLENDISFYLILKRNGKLLLLDFAKIPVEILHFIVPEKTTRFNELVFDYLIRKKIFPEKRSTRYGSGKAYLFIFPDDLEKCLPKITLGEIKP